jgi:hypothetical protein
MNTDNCKLSMKKSSIFYYGKNASVEEWDGKIK